MTRAGNERRIASTETQTSVRRIYRHLCVLLGLLSLTACGTAEDSSGHGGDAGTPSAADSKGGSPHDSGSSGVAGAAGVAGADRGVGGGASGGVHGDTGGDSAGAHSGTGGGSAGAHSGSGGAAGGEPTTFDGDCTPENIRCVAPADAPMSEYQTIQAAVDAAGPGDRVVVFAGSYAGVRVERGGTAAAPLRISAVEDGVLIDRDGPTTDAIRLQDVSDVSVEGFTIEGPTEACIGARGAEPDQPMARLVIRGNTCRRAGHEGFYLSEVSHSLVENNVISETGQNGDPRGHGIYLANAGSDFTTLRRNHIHDLAMEESAGIHFNGDLSVGGDGIIEGLVVDGNVLHGLVHNALNMDGVQDSLITNNLVFDVQAHALRAYAIDGAEGPVGLTVVNNTFDLSDDGRSPFKVSEDGGGHVVFNNILLTENENDGSIMVEDPAGVTSSHNAVVDRFSPDGDAIVSLVEWQALGLDAGSMVVDASLFVARGSDYRVNGGSPTLDAGLAEFSGTSAPANDIEGRPRPGGAAVDLGAYEAD
jgi:hypothetical protein